MKTFLLGIDIGSTTAKIVLAESRDRILYTEYIRHNLKILETIREILSELRHRFGDLSVRVAFTGSAGMGIAEMTGQTFIQEIVAAGHAAESIYPGIKSLIDIGGEDAKLVLFSDAKKPDIRMNGNCAGGTGAYIDQMASLLGVTVAEMDEMAVQANRLYPIASRCGVFAKTDVQNLLSRKVPHSDIAASIFRAVASQTINALARGCSIEPRLLFCGGPLTYISNLREAFRDLLGLSPNDIIVPNKAELFTALGTAISVKADQPAVRISGLIDRLVSIPRPSGEGNTLPVLFDNNEHFEQWREMRPVMRLAEKEPDPREHGFLGIDSGSTTTKICVINAAGELLYSFYQNNNGKPLETVVAGLRQLREKLLARQSHIIIDQSGVTGYGEELIRSALGIDHGIVETLAHFVAAKYIEPEVSFILDIGGQDIKAITIRNDTITNIEINEACSSGCGSFIEGFAGTLGYTPADFSTLAAGARAPYDLGSRCTVFMNSKVKQALRDGASVADLSAGLAYSVVKNCLNKVLKIKSTKDIGDHIVVQGGTFRNMAVFRSLEILSGKKVVSADKPELMGAMGAALFARRQFEENGRHASRFIGLSSLEGVQQYTTKLTVCKGCTNNCKITVYHFHNGHRCYSGNKCEKHFSNNPETLEKQENIIAFKKDLLFNRSTKASGKTLLRLGIPRILNMYENFPFWNTLFTLCGIEVVLSDESSGDLYQSGNGAVMSDNICFPAKLSHGHIVNLAGKNVDAIFYPFVVYEKKEFATSGNSFNCPIVTGYSEVLKSTSGILEKSGIPFHSPSINFDQPALLYKACRQYLRYLGVRTSLIEPAFKAANAERMRVQEAILQKNRDILADAIAEQKPLVLLAGHPYHIDQLIHQQVSQMLSDLGVGVINEEIARGPEGEGFEEFFTVSQWEYPNRVLQAAWWVSRLKHNVGLIQLNSFGCGPDSFIIDEIGDLTRRLEVPYALLRIDEIASPGSIRLRLRSLVASLKLRNHPLREEHQTATNERNVAVFQADDRWKSILVPWFSDFYSPFIPIIGDVLGYKVINLPPSDQQSIDYGLEYANNEICYPATLVVGDILRALNSGRYPLPEVAVGITQTGGQCRATNYIALIKRAMVSSGYGDIPVIAVATSEGLNNEQPGFSPDWQKALRPAAAALMFADSLSRMYYATVCREKEAGITNKLRDHYLDQGCVLMKEKNYRGLLPLLEKAVRDFNALPVVNEPIQAVGVVGEIYIKFNAFGQFDVINWLVQNRVEVVQPPLLHFFMQSFVNTRVMKRENLQDVKSNGFLMAFLEWGAERYIAQFERVLRHFRHYRPVYDIRHEAKLASEILSLANQYGEGWLIPGEIASFSRLGIHNVICMQPFGCIANHIIGKGMEKKIKQIYPKVNLLFLDFDYGTSKINIINRLHFLLQNQETLVES